jgi:hypothetical protein
MPIVKPCAHCGQDFIVRRRFDETKLCSRECAAAAKRKAPVPCVGCGEPFAPVGTRMRYCSFDCFSDRLRGHPEPSPIEGARWIELGKGRFALVDEDLFADLNRYRWCARGGGLYGFYAHRAVRIDEPLTGDTMPMHHQVLPPPAGFLIDHINRNTLDNRRANLRIASPADNVHNSVRVRGVPTSGFRGVTRDKKRWAATIVTGCQSRRIGTFDTAEEAARAYDDAARMYHREFARLNFPREGERSARVA